VTDVGRQDWKKDLRALYSPPSRPTVVDVPAMRFLMLDGHGDPNTEPRYREVIEALFSLAYTVKFAARAESSADFAVYPLEGLWWVPDMREFTIERKTDWDWTMMIAQPEPVTSQLVEEARSKATAKKGLAPLGEVRFEQFTEGRCAQVMHTGPFAAEAPVIEGVHAFIRDLGGELAGKHHEIYLSDPRRTAQEKLRTVIRQPFTGGRA